MRRSGWTPSIVPNGDDQTVYLVLDDFGQKGRAWREVDAETTDLETVILDLLEGRTKIRSGSLASTPPRNGRRTFRPTSPMNFAAAATYSSATCRFFCKTSSTDMRTYITMSSFRCRYASCDHGVPA